MGANLDEAAMGAADGIGVDPRRLAREVLGSLLVGVKELEPVARAAWLRRERKRTHTVSRKRATKHVVWKVFGR